MSQAASDLTPNDRALISDRNVTVLRLIVLAIWMIACTAALGALLWCGS